MGNPLVNGREYVRYFNIIECYNTLDKENGEPMIFTIRLPTEDEAKMLMEDLEGEK